MRIVHVYVSLDPAQGGPPIVVEKLARLQIESGLEVRIAAEKVCGVSGVSTVTLPRHSILDSWRRPRPQVAHLAEWADVLHLHGVWEPLLPAMAHAAISTHRPYVVTPHGMLDPWSLAQKKWKKKLALALGYRHMLNRAAAIHVLNADEQRLIGPLKLTQPFQIIPIGIALENLDPPPNPELFRASIPGLADRTFVLFVSRLHFKKGLDYLADAFAIVAQKHPTCDLVVAGPDGGEQEPFRRRIEKLGLSRRTWFAGWLSDAMKASALAGASIYCLPSRQEGFSMAILEALACRVPVVISDQCHFPEVAEVGAGRVVPLDAVAIADALDFVLSHPNERAQMGAAGRKLVESRYTWPKVNDEMIALYQRVASAS